MSLPVPVLFRRVDPELEAAAKALVLAIKAELGEQGVKSPEDALRFALKVGMYALQAACAGDPDTSKAAARRVVCRMLEAKTKISSQPAG